MVNFQSDMTRFHIQYTRHALSALKERSLSKELVELAVRGADWKEAASGEVWCAFKRIGRKVLRVVVKGKREPLTVITAYYDRRKI